ncbi:MAG: PA2779 family protein [Desulfobacterales bacterium]
MLAIFMFMLSGPYQSAMAAMIDTESVLDSGRAHNARAYLKTFLAREDVKSALISQGIDPQEARNRIDSLTEEEARFVADQLDQMPAGGGFFTTLLIVIFLVFVILLVTDITGYTDIFPFVKSK